jgi:hypothetical protein
MTDLDYLELQRRIDDDIERVSALYVKQRAKKAVTKPRRKCECSRDGKVVCEAHLNGVSVEVD